MDLVNIRVDSRLIHGQVAAMWTGVLKATRIMVIDNEVVKNDMMKRVLKMACPKNCKLSILNTDVATTNIKNHKYEGDRVFIIVKSPSTLVELLKCGFPLKEVTIGNINATNGSRQIKRTICISEKDEINLRYLSQEGVKLIAQMVPSEEKTDLIKLL